MEKQLYVVGDLVVRCPFCNYGRTRVLDKRTSKKKSVNRRRRLCENCNNKFTTKEFVVSNDLKVVKRSGNVERFDEDKIVDSLRKACNKRPIPSNFFDSVVKKVKLRAYEHNPLPTKEIGEIVLDELKKVDEISYLRFVSVYKDFKDLNSFEKELLKIRGG